MNSTRWMRPAGRLALVAGVVTIAAGLMALPSLAADARSASSVLTELNVSEVPGQGVSAFDGDYGTAATPDLSLASDADDGDFSDPDGVLRYVTIHGQQISATSWDEATGQLTARTNATGFEMDYNGVDDFIVSGSIDSYARCLNGGDALAYARGDGSLTHVLGREVPGEVPTAIDVTGDDLNMPGVDSGTLTVTVHRVEDAVNEPNEVSAEAHLSIGIEADLKDSSGNTVYNGHLMTMNEGHVKVTCTPSAGPTSSSTSSSPYESPTTSASSSAAPTSATSTSGSSSTAPTTASTSSSGSPTTPTSASGSATGVAGTTGGGTTLPVTGGGLWPPLLGGLGGIAFGVALLALAGRRSGT